MGVGDVAVQLGAVACAIAIDTGDWDWALGTTGTWNARVSPKRTASTSGSARR